MNSKLKKVKITSDGVLGTVFIDGVDMTHGIFAVAYIHKAGEPPAVSVSMYVDEVEIDVEAAVSEEKHEKFKEELFSDHSMQL